MNSSSVMDGWTWYESDAGEAYLTAMAARWSCLAPAPESMARRDDVQYGWNGKVELFQMVLSDSEGAMLLAPARLHGEDPGGLGNWCNWQKIREI